MPTYATVADVESYIVGWVTDDATALARIIVQAEHDVDSVLGAWDLDALTGLKWSATELAAYEIAALRDATCAQTEYRLQQGPDFFIFAQPKRVSGPDFSIEQAEPYIGPKVWIELARAPRLRAPVGLGRAIV